MTAFDADAHEEAALVGGKALERHYATNQWQTFHHEPSVAAVVIDGLTAAGWLLSPPVATDYTHDEADACQRVYVLREGE